MRRPKKDIQLTSYDELLGLEETPEKSMNQVVEIDLAKLYPFKNHPFHVNDDEKMAETVESIKTYGVLTPALVRPRPDGGYEMISGHRRKRGCELCGKTTLPALVRNYTDDEAVIIMVDSNIQRENLLPSEKAHAYKMKYDAKEDVDELVELMIEVMMMPEDSMIRIAGVEKPVALVKSRFMKLNYSHIEYVLFCLNRNTTKVGNIKAYLLTALYNAPATINSYYQAEVNHDMYGG